MRGGEKREKKRAGGKGIRVLSCQQHDVKLEVDRHISVGVLGEGMDQGWEQRTGVEGWWINDLSLANGTPRENEVFI